MKLLNLGTKPTVQSVLAGFYKVVEQLDGITIEKHAEAVEKDNQASMLLAEARDARHEAQRAERIAQRIAAIFED
jgi:hypothetical protein